ncbi:16S rRNA (cytidine(1402)-2'-O)-methyltransferase [Croceicoccus sp. F390]|uniref:Ribosomal RNA small subunit methyltransferase I n=1 Tax=Croceicoccus esteveae TaxID=3075597 RepID=A0ABU2ZGP4_9SPHN|nr:16S rRNA (cytidine(1402)-2'-O)-methyltransferase [Croceicoccus sp. F390]MDT0575551.1 16S rRNA (cytidine(1402)-2'-O)-methyltransferase [Croceicoccus sp. F390]
MPDPATQYPAPDEQASSTPLPDTSLEPGLYIVATPIGNLGDITQRAADALARCDVIACEDTRVTGRLLHHMGLHKRMIRYDDHADDVSRDRLLGLMATQAVALVSDAGTPLVSDPGYRLVRAAHQQGIALTALPGPSAAIMALTLSGLPTDRFLFAGFMPVKDKARSDIMTELAGLRATLIFYETAPRLVSSLLALAGAWPARDVAVARELTKKFEECRVGTAQALAEHYTAHPPRGEIVLLVGPPAAPSTADLDIDAMLREQLLDKKASQAAAYLARLHGLDRKTLYERALKMKEA